MVSDGDGEKKPTKEEKLEAENKKLKSAGMSTMKTGPSKDTSTAQASSAPAKLPGESDFAYNYRMAQMKKASAA